MNYKPELFELTDWIVATFPELWEAIKYLHAPAQYACMLKVWSDNGKPCIE